jgi:hypothetical protein
MIAIEKATLADAITLAEIQTRTFQDDNNLQPPGYSMEGPPGYDSVDWNAGWIETTPSFKILLDGQIAGGIIVFDMGQFAKTGAKAKIRVVWSWDGASIGHPLGSCQ